MRWAGLIVLLLTFACSVPQKRGVVPSTLVVGVDGVSYQTFKKMQDGGYFKAFNRAAPMVATFPSISDPNWTRLMGLPPEQCYTKACFDPSIKTPTGFGKETGNLMSHVAEHPRYEQVMDFHPNGALEHISMIIWTETTAKFWLQSLKKNVLQARGEKEYFALFINSDLIAHTSGEKGQMQFLQKLDAEINGLLRDYYKKFHRKLEVVIVSDHGNFYTEPIDVPFESFLEETGWKLADTISGPKDVGFFVPEILSFGAFHTQPKSRHKLAQDLSKVQNIHLTSTVNDQGSIDVYSDHNKGHALITINETQKTVMYEVKKGKDPLEHAHLFKKGPLSFQRYFDQTIDSIYPNAAVRIWEGFFKNSKTSPSVLADPELGYVFGNKALRLLTNIKDFTATHGGLHREESLGIVASTTKELQPMTPDEFQKLVNVKPLKDPKRLPSSYQKRWQ